MSNNYIILSNDPLINGGVTPIQVTGPAAPAIPASGTVITSNGDGTSSWQAGSGGGGGPPTGAAGGDLGGTYPNPTVLSVAHITTGKLPIANIAAGTANQVLLNNATPAPVWTTLTGDVTNVVGAMSVVSITGASSVVPIAATGNVLTWAAATTSPGLTQISTSSVTQGQNLTITPQQSTQATNNGGGNLVIALQTPTGTGAEAAIQITRGGTVIGSLQPLVSTGTQIALYSGSATPTSSNYVFSNTGAQSSINASTSAVLQIGAANTFVVQAAQIKIAPPIFEWNSTVSAPTLTQISITSGSGSSATGTAGQTMAITAQAGQTETGTTSIGGAGGSLIISSGVGGTGTSTNGKGGAVIITGAQQVSVISKSTTYAVDTGSTTADYVILTTGNAFTLTLPVPTAGRVLIFKDAAGNASTQNKTISHNASETIDGATTYVLNLNYSSVMLVSDGTNWFSMAVASGSAV